MFEASLILGGARSGKSQFAENFVLQTGKQPIYIATAQIHDEEMRQRITLHQDRRRNTWQTIETPIELVAVINKIANEHKIILVDCLTLWLSNLMLANHNIEEASHALCDLVTAPPCDLVLVANEVGLGIVPDNALARQFRDAAGQLNQYIAARVKNVYFVAAGLPLRLKG